MLTINDNLNQGRYRIVGQLGLSGSGPAYEAYDNILQTNVVLREIPFKLNKVTTPAQMENLKVAFSNEAKILTSINHGSFIHVRDHFSEIDRHYLVMEPVDGDFLSELLEKNGGAFPLSDVTDWADQLLDALGYLHTQNPVVIHRDIKPQNIKLTSDGRVKLLALATVRNSDAGSGGNSTAFEATSLNYLPLEQIWGKLDLASQKVISNSYDEASEELLMQPPDVRSDIYAVGATLYHLITARHPIDALERSIDILEGKPDPLPTPSKVDPNIPPEISYVLMKALELKREKRFDSAMIMRQVLKTAALRAKEREAQEAKKQPVIAAPEIRLPEPKQFGHRAPAEQKTPEGEAGREAQLELIKARLQEAENKRLLAEQRAAEAEKRLREKESLAPNDTEILALVDLIKEDPAPVLDLPVIAPDIREQSAAAEDHSQVLDLSNALPELPDTLRPFAAAKHSPREFEFTFTEQPKDKKGLWRVLALAAVLLVVSGAGFGVWSFLSSGSAGPDKQAPGPAMSLTDQTKPETPAENVETAPPANTAATVETNPAQVEPAAPGSAGQPALKVKTAVAPQAKKPETAAAKATPKPKKAVTVDDLINDN